MKSTETIKVPVVTPNSKDDPNDVKTEHIPLPPAGLWETLDNSGDTPTAEAAEPVTSNAGTPHVIHDFIGPNRRSKDIPLAYPFRLKDREITSITVRRLTLGEVQALLERFSGKQLTSMDIYAEMTGLTPEILRGLDDEDGEQVTDVAYSFFPPRLRPESASSET